MNEDRFIVGLDIGTTKTTIVISEKSLEANAYIIGQGSASHVGIKNGIMIDFDSVINAIKESVNRAERMSGTKIEKVILSVPGNHLKAITSKGLVAIRKDQEITVSDVKRAIENARSIPLDENLKIIHVLPQEYEIDGQKGIRNPIGMTGTRLEVSTHIIAARSDALQNLHKCAQSAGLHVTDFASQSLASGISTAHTSEVANSLLVIDMGGNNTDIGIFYRGSLIRSASIPMGANFITNDLAQILAIPYNEAEEVKIKYGSAIKHLAEQDLILEITNLNSKTISISAEELSQIINPRVEEIFEMVRTEILSSLGNVEEVVQSAILTGGGVELKGILEVARQCLRIPVRIGKPNHIEGLIDAVNTPSYSAAVGLVLYGINKNGRLITQMNVPQQTQQPKVIKKPVVKPIQKTPKPLVQENKPTEAQNNTSDEKTKVEKNGFINKIKKFWDDLM